MRLIMVPGTYYWNYNYSQLKKEHGDLHVILYEHPELFVSYAYHKSAVIYRRLCGIELQKHLTEIKVKCTLVRFGDHETFMDNLLRDRRDIKDIYFVDPTNDRIYNEFTKNKFKMLPGMSFYFQPEFFADKHFWTNGSLYNYVCKDTKFKFGGKSYDHDNRNKLPVDRKYPDKFPVEPYTEIFQDIEQLNLWGSGNIYFPTDRKGALRALDNFMDNILPNFGPYQDSMDFRSGHGNVIYHSAISAMLNIGLLCPREDILPRILRINTKGIEQSVEGFFRQIFGWREFMRQIWLKGVWSSEKKYICSWPEFMTKHYSKHYFFDRRDHKKERRDDKEYKKDLKESQNDLIKIVIGRAYETGYIHHIERLMVLGNYLMMSQCDPVDAIKQFLGLTVDAYPWVMYGNVVYMSQYALGRVYTTKPYFSSGNYIKKMSIIPKEISMALKEFDSLYHGFIKKYKDRLPTSWH